MSGTFDFCDTSRVIQELPPEAGSAVDMNGWEFTSKPAIPYRRTFTIKLYGMRWYMGTGALDSATNPKFNAGRLLSFYRLNQTWDVFDMNHEYLGNILCRFKSPVTIPPAEMNSNGKIAPFDVSLIQYNPGF